MWTIAGIAMLVVSRPGCLPSYPQYAGDLFPGRATLTRDLHELLDALVCYSGQFACFSESFQAPFPTNVDGI